MGRQQHAKALSVSTLIISTHQHETQLHSNGASCLLRTLISIRQKLNSVSQLRGVHGSVGGVSVLDGATMLWSCCMLALACKHPESDVGRGRKLSDISEYRTTHTGFAHQFLIDKRLPRYLMARLPDLRGLAHAHEMLGWVTIPSSQQRQCKELLGHPLSLIIDHELGQI